MKKTLQIVLCSFAVLTLAGCKKDDAALKNANDTLVSFKNSELNITVSDLYEKLRDQYGTSYLIDMVDEKLLNLKYETDDIANKYINDQIKTYQTYYGGEDKLLTALQENGYSSIAEFSETLLLNYKRELALKDYVRATITDSEIDKYYKNEMFGDITASHILITVKKTDSMTDDEKKEAEESAKTKIAEIYEKLEDGKEFSDLAKEYSEDTATASNGGHLYSFNKGDMVTAFEDAVIKLKVGEYTKTAVQTEYGYHIIYKEKESPKADLATVKQTIIDNLVDEKINANSKLQYESLIELRKEYGIVINDQTLSTNYDNAVNNWLYSK